MGRRHNKSSGGLNDTRSKSKGTNGADKSASKSSETVAAAESDLECKGAFAAFEVDEDWTSDMDKNSTTHDSMPYEDSLASIEKADPVSNITSDTTANNAPHMETFDSGCTCHISPYCNDFQTYKDIGAKHFKAAKTQKFTALGKGKMIINI
ncbi:hypothetical protein H0H87_008179 [Tephrocybe sp. NHM501043]|nr:hypothetical protein H0H87_008179 [Tephrocybe sp. NHM501043]